jgi:hypothetical protein
MEVDLSPEAEETLKRRAAQRGLSAHDLAVSLLQEHIEELNRTETMLDGRYDELKSGRVQLVPGEEVTKYFRKKSDSARLPLAS